MKNPRYDGPWTREVHANPDGAEVNECRGAFDGTTDVVDLRKVDVRERAFTMPAAWAEVEENDGGVEGKEGYKAKGGDVGRRNTRGNASPKEKVLTEEAGASKSEVERRDEDEGKKPGGRDRSKDAEVGKGKEETRASERTSVVTRVEAERTAEGVERDGNEDAMPIMVGVREPVANVLGGMLESCERDNP